MAARLAQEYNPQQFKFDEVLRTISLEYASLREENERLSRLVYDTADTSNGVPMTPLQNAPKTVLFTSEPEDSCQFAASYCETTATRSARSSRPSITELKLEKLQGQSRELSRAYRDEYVEMARNRAQSIIEQRWFDIMIGMVILVNSACLGAESELQRDTPEWLHVLEQVFLCIYMFELALRLFARGWYAAFSDPWFLFDLVLVVTSCIYSLVVSLTKNSGTGGADIVKKIVIFRVLRLLRLLRALRLVPVLKDAWNLTFSLIASTSTIISTLALLLLALYLYACLGIEIITNDPIFKEDEIVSYYFGDLLSIMLTLTQFVTMDDISSLYVPLIKKKPVLVIYFLSIILIISVALMNLVTAVLVDRARENSSNNKEEAQKEMARRIHKALPGLKALFHQLDRDVSGTITFDEMLIPVEQLTEILGNDVMKDGHNETMKELFEVLDVDASGKVCENEFVDGLMTLALAEFSAVPSAESVLLLRLMRSNRRSNDNLLNTFERLFDLLSRLEEKMHDEPYLVGENFFV